MLIELLAIWFDIFIPDVPLSHCVNIQFSAPVPMLNIHCSRLMVCKTFTINIYASFSACMLVWFISLVYLLIWQEVYLYVNLLASTKKNFCWNLQVRWLFAALMILLHRLAKEMGKCVSPLEMHLIGWSFANLNRHLIQHTCYHHARNIYQTSLCCWV